MLYEVFAAEESDTDSDELDVNDDAISTDGKTAVVTSSNHGHINHRTMFTLAIATSIDAMAAGFTLNLLALNAWLACFIIAVITAVFGWIGVYLGRRSGTWLEEKAEVLGGVVLIAIGVKVMFFG